jgi:hypothetical protein
MMCERQKEVEAMAHHEANAALDINVGLAASAMSRHNLVQHHLWNAQHAARLCRDREDDLTALNHRLPDVELNGTAMVAVMSSVAFLEALVNEAYLDAADPLLRKAGLLEGISDDAVTAMADRWNAKPSVERQKILAKFKIALGCAGAAMDLGREPAHSVKLLVDLRDTLTHYKPQWQGDETEALFAELRKRLPVNDRVAECNPWFPHQALSADLAEWAWKTTLTLAQEWWRGMGLVRNPIPDLASWKRP